MKVEAAVLHRLIYNTKLFQVGSGAPSTNLSFAGGSVAASVSDGQTYLQDMQRVDRDPNEKEWGIKLPLGTTRQMELDLRDMEGELEVWISGATILTANGNVYVGEEDTYPYALDRDSVLFPAYHSALKGRPFALWGERFSKLNLIQPRDYPVDFRTVWHSSLQRELLLFKKGPTVSGCTAVVERSILEEKEGAQHFLWSTAN